jgi:hypothetical protein
LQKNDLIPFIKTRNSNWKTKAAATTKQTNIIASDLVAYDY